MSSSGDRAFWTFCRPLLLKHLGAEFEVYSVAEMYGTANLVTPDFIRVEADEATYDLHILLRFSIERRLLNRTLEVADVPEAWNTEFESLFGFRPPDDANGCLQDIHWSMGGLGYFSTYSIGNLNAAQLHGAAINDEEVASACTRAAYLPLLKWMQDKVHATGSTLLPQDLMESVTGERTNPEHYLAHLPTRFC